jgi:hypothetical protein
MSDNIPMREPDEIRRDCARKLRSVKVSDHFLAILGCLLGEDWTTPRLAEMVITPDGHLLGRCEGEAAFSPCRAATGRRCSATAATGCCNRTRAERERRW